MESASTLTAEQVERQLAEELTKRLSAVRAFTVEEHNAELEKLVHAKAEELRAKGCKDVTVTKENGLWHIDFKYIPPKALESITITSDLSAELLGAFSDD